MTLILTVPSGQPNQLVQLIAEAQTPVTVLTAEGNGLITGIWSIEQFVDPVTKLPPVAGVGVSATQRAINVRAIQAGIDFVRSHDPGFGHGGTLMFPPGVWEIATAPLKVAATADYIAGIQLAGVGGRYTSCVKQTDPTLNVLEVTDTTVNIRSVQVLNLTLIGGLNGLYMINAIYNLFTNVVFEQQANYGCYCDVNSFCNLDDCWWIDQVTSNCLYVGQSGSVFCNGCWFGEASGGILIDGGRLFLTNCYLYDCADNLNLNTFGAGHPVFYVQSGGSLTVTGGEYIARSSNCAMFIFGFVAGEICIDGGCIIQLPSNVTGFLREYLANSYDRVFSCKPGNVVSECTTGLLMYFEVTTGPPDTTHARKNSFIDCAVQYRTTPPSVGVMWLDNEQNNQTRLRPRPILP